MLNGRIRTRAGSAADALPNRTKTSTLMKEHMNAVFIFVCNVALLSAAIYTTVHSLLKSLAVSAVNVLKSTHKLQT